MGESKGEAGQAKKSKDQPRTRPPSRNNPEQKECQGAGHIGTTHEEVEDIPLEATKLGGAHQGVSDWLSDLLAVAPPMDLPVV